eukprot:s2975_g7.t2
MMASAQEEEGGPGLVEFLSGAWLSSAPLLRSQLVGHCLAVGAIATRSWPVVLSACCDAAECQEAVLAVVAKHGDDPAVHDWAQECSQKDSLAAGFRLRLYARYAKDPGSEAVVAWRSLQLSAEAAVLSGERLPPEALSLIDASRLWPQLLARRAVLAAAALIHAAPRFCADSDEVTALANAMLKGGSQAEARAACGILEALRGPSASALLAALCSRQPLHLLEGLPAPAQDFHKAAACLALRYGDRRIPGLVLPLLHSDCALLPEVCVAAASGESWTHDWWEAKAKEGLRSQNFLGLEALLKDTSILERLAQGWLQLPLSRSDRFGTGSAEAWSQAAVVLRKLRLALPSLALTAAELVRACFSEAAVRLPADASVSQLISLASVAPRLAAKGLGFSADSALAALAALSAARAEASAEGFELWLDDIRCGFVAWSDARAACFADPFLVASYPRQDPEYQQGELRRRFVSLGPMAASHATAEELAEMMEVPKLSSAEKLALLHAAKGSARSAKVLNAVRGWIADPGSDRHVVSAAASLLADVGSRTQDFLDLFPRLKAAKALTSAAGILDAGVPSEALGLVLGSSSLCTALAQRRLASGEARDSKLLALLAVKASARDSRHLADDHPALQICRARSMLSQKDRTDLVRNLLSLRGSLTTEGSPHGDGHGQNLRPCSTSGFL